MRFEDLAARLVSVEAKLATLTGTSVNTHSATSIEELDARLSIVEVQVDQLITVKIQSQIEAIVAAPAADAPVAVEAVVALSASSDVPAAADIVADVVTAQVDASSVQHSEVAGIIAAGLDGISRKLKLEDAFVGNAYASDSDRVPSTMLEAQKLWSESAWVKSVFGADVQAHYTNMAQVELDAYGKAVTDWELFRNFERF